MINLRVDHYSTLDELAAEFDVSRERIRQIEVAALKKCRAWCFKNGYRIEDLLGDSPQRRGTARRVAEE